MTPAPSSFLSPIGYRNSSCGYCHNRSGSFSYYASTTSLEAEFYQSLLNRGWRRSGTLLYKPDLRAACCPQYTIRLDSSAFRASKDQRQALNRFNKHILGDPYTKEAARLYPKSREQAKKRNTEFALTERVHECEEGQVKTPPSPAHALVVTLEEDGFTEEKYTLFENYQRLVHHEPPHRISKAGFKDFLCSSPLKRSKETFDKGERLLGSYHQCYRLDGKLVAVGVLDLLPQCVSAVYFMYHESVHEHTFGKIGALREIALAKEEGYRWWYAGFYIHSCVKMRYKGDFVPQFALDPVSYIWNPLDEEMKKRLDANKFVTLSKEPSESRSTEDSAVTMTKSEVVDGGDEDSEDDTPVPFPELPLFSRSMPGILTKKQLLTEIDIDRINLRLRGQDVKTGDLIDWQNWELDRSSSIKCAIAELVAAVGTELGAKMIVYFASA